MVGGTVQEPAEEVKTPLDDFEELSPGQDDCASTEIIICPGCNAEIDPLCGWGNGECENYRCQLSPYYEPPCTSCGSHDYLAHDRETNELICKDASCKVCPWYNPYVQPPSPDLAFDDPLYRAAWREYLWRNIERYLWLNPGVTFDETLKEMRWRFGVFYSEDGEKSFRDSMRGRVERGELVRHHRGWRMAKMPVRSYWVEGEILEIAGVSIE